jgi:probable rRNA maturation factor
VIEILVDEGVDMARMPGAARASAAAQAAFALAGGTGEPSLCVRFAPDAAVQALNRDWRHKDKVTDVLSFPIQDGEIDATADLGDIALAVPFVEREAARLALPVADHALHLIVHGVLHLMGYDHEDDAEAAEMQALERRAMAGLGLHDPYPFEEMTDVG